MSKLHKNDDVTETKMKDQVIRVGQINIDGLSKHSTIALDKFISDHSIDILALQEVGSTRPNDDIFIKKTFYYSYAARGVGLAVSNTLRPDLVPELIDSEVDATFATLTIGNTSVVVGSCYCRPEINSTKSLKELLAHIKKAWAWCKSKKIRNMVVLGDFNARSVSWGDTISNARGKLLSEYVERSDDILLHSAGNKTFLHSAGGSVIDLTLTFGDISSRMSSPWTEQCYTLFTGAPQKGHIPVLQNITTDWYETEERKEVFDYDSANWDMWHAEAKQLFSEALQVDYSSDAMMFEKFLSIVSECSKKHIPVKTICRHSKPYWSEKLTTLSKNLQVAQKKYRLKSDPINKASKELCSDTFKVALVSEKNEWIHRKLEGLNTQESLLFWQRYKKMFKPKADSFIGHLEKESGLAHTDKEKEEVLYETFFTGSHLKNRVFDDAWLEYVEDSIDELKLRNWDIDMLKDWNNNNCPPSDETEPVHTHTFDNNYLNKTVEINEVIDAVKVQKSAGKCKDIDKIHPLLLKRLPIEGLKFLTNMYNSVLENGKWVWDSSIVSFIKKADKDSYVKPGAFRPLTIASYVGKILERVLAKRLILFCQESKVIDSAQEGFLPNRSTTRYLYKMTASVAEARRKRMSTLLLFLDFEKAFDSVSTSSMIFKLNQHGISGKFLRLLHNFLTDKSVSLRVNRYVGPNRTVGKFGLPQGSVLSPLLFVIFVADLLSDEINFVGLGNASSVIVFKYADDGSIMVNASTTTECYNMMQSICNILSQWCYKWQLVVNCNKDKTEAVVIKSHDSECTTLPNLTICNQQIQYVRHSKVLGIYFDDNIAFQKHAKYVLKSCWYQWHRLSNKTTRKQGLNCSALILLFKTSVLTRLLYAAPIWLKGNIDIFKDFMYRALFKISGSQFYPPLELLQVIFGIAPLFMTLEIMTTKFILKSLTQDDEFKAMLLQLEETPQHPFYSHLTAVKRFLVFQNLVAEKKSKRRVYRTSFLDYEIKSFIYTQDQMITFMCDQWDEQLVCNIDKFCKLNMDCLHNLKEYIKTFNVMKKPIFLRNSNRTEDTNLIDFIHGQSMRFTTFRSKFDGEFSPNISSCIDCGSEVDIPTHKLFTCIKFEGQQRNELVSCLEECEDQNFKLYVIFSPEVKIRHAFRDMVKLICYESAGNDCYINRT